jgi:hypothetical protein
MIGVRNKGIVHASNVQFCCILFLCKLINYYLHPNSCTYCILFVRCTCIYPYFTLSPASFHAFPPDVSLNIKANNYKSTNILSNILYTVATHGHITSIYICGYLLHMQAVKADLSMMSVRCCGLYISYD